MPATAFACPAGKAACGRIRRWRSNGTVGWRSRGSCARSALVTLASPSADRAGQLARHTGSVLIADVDVTERSRVSSTYKDVMTNLALLEEPNAFIDRAVRLCFISLIYVALTILVFRDFIPHLSTVLIGPPEDNQQDFWGMWYGASRIRALHDFYYTNLIRYPEGTTLSYWGPAYPKLSIAIIFGAVFGYSTNQLVTLHNLLLVVSVPISGIGAFYLVRHFTNETTGAFIGGALFAFNPFHITEVLHHMGVSSVEFIPFFVLSFILAIEKRSLGFLMLSTLFFALNALSCWYYLFYCSYFIVFYYSFLSIKLRRVVNAWPLVVVFTNMAGVLIILSPFLVPMIALTGPKAYHIGTDIWAP